MGELSIPDAEDPGEMLEPFIEQARKRLEGEPDRRMVARVSEDPAYDKWDASVLRPASAPLGPTLLGQPALLRKSVALPLAAYFVGLPITFGLAAAREMAIPPQVEMALGIAGVIVVLTAVVTLLIGLSTMSSYPKGRGAVRSLPASPLENLPRGRDRRELLDGGEEAKLARHSAAALWNLHAGTASRAWKSTSLADWRAKVDLQSEARETIRAAGALQDLRLALGDFPVYVDGEAKAKWRADFEVYRAGLSSLRDRVEQQVALQLAVEAIGRQLDTPIGQRAELADRIAASVPRNELAIENLAELADQSVDMLALLNLKPLTIDGDRARTDNDAPAVPQPEHSGQSPADKHP